MNSKPFDLLKCALQGSTLLEASAGTGKTWNICEIVLRLLLETDILLPQILVVTFTSAASAELQTRIQARLRSMLSGIRAADAQGVPAHLPDAEASEKMLRHVLDKGATPEMLIAKLELALQSMDDATICTIHSFCHRILSDTAFSAGYAFESRLETDDRDLMLEIIQDFWRTRMAEENLDADFAAWLQRKHTQPETLLPVFKRALQRPLAQNRWPEAPPPQDFSALHAEHRALAMRWQAEKETLIAQLEAACAQGWLNGNKYRAGAIAASFRHYEAFFACDNIIALEFEDDTHRNAIARFTQSYLKGAAKKNAPLVEHPFFEALDALLKAREKAREALESARMLLIRDLLAHTHTYRQRKRERQVMGYDDMLFNLHAALTQTDDRQHKKYPWLPERIRQHYRAALIDEFQDTDPLQYDIFHSIYADSAAPVFFVGDPKQAIYRFRHADLHTYLKARNAAHACYTLTENYRAIPALVNATNRLFSANPQAFMLPELHFYPASSGARPISPLEDLRPDAPESPLVLWYLPDEAGHWPLRPAALAQATHATADEVARLLNAAAQGTLTIDGRPLQAQDIAIIVRSHREGRLIRDALLERHISSVSHAQDSIFHSPEAEELTQLLRAILRHTHLPWLRTALATRIMGRDAADLEAFTQTVQSFMPLVERFARYHHIWETQGIRFVLRQLFMQEAVYSRLLAHPDGDRQLTNLHHLGELLAQAAEQGLAPEALLRWLEDQRQENSTADEALLRLESDEKRVHIVTIHRAKGQEYPIVFCPYLWDAQPNTRGLQGDGWVYQEEEQGIIDFRLLPESDTRRIRTLIEQEEAEESLRLIYVALTRAKHRAYLVAGGYLQKNAHTPSPNHSLQGTLNWLVAGREYTREDWLNLPEEKSTRKLEVPLRKAAIDAAWLSLAPTSGGYITLRHLPALRDPILLTQPLEPQALEAAEAPARIPAGWRMSSFSHLTRNLGHSVIIRDRDELIADTPAMLMAPEDAPEALSEEDILRFPRGVYAGNCLHAILEKADFSDSSGWQSLIDSAWQAWPQIQRSPLYAPDSRLYQQRAALEKKRLENMLHHLVNTPLMPELTLAALPAHRRVHELAFQLAASDLQPTRVHALLRTQGYAVPPLPDTRFCAYLQGSIDMVFEHEGRYYLLDWKSNHLGDSPAHYDAMHMEAAMQEHGYHLQALLYALALHRFLGSRLPEYQYETHFGGIFYLFVRGVRPDWKTADHRPCGIWTHRPSADTLAQLDALFTPVRGSLA